MRARVGLGMLSLLLWVGTAAADGFDRTLHEAATDDPVQVWVQPDRPDKGCVWIDVRNPSTHHYHVTWHLDVLWENGTQREDPGWIDVGPGATAANGSWTIDCADLNKYDAFGSVQSVAVWSLSIVDTDEKAKMDQQAKDVAKMYQPTSDGSATSDTTDTTDTSDTSGTSDTTDTSDPSDPSGSDTGDTSGTDAAPVDVASADTSDTSSSSSGDDLGAAARADFGRGPLTGEVVFTSQLGYANGGALLGGAVEVRRIFWTAHDPPYDGQPGLPTRGHELGIVAAAGAVLDPSGGPDGYGSTSFLGRYDLRYRYWWGPLGVGAVYTGELGAGARDPAYLGSAELTYAILHSQTEKNYRMLFTARAAVLGGHEVGAAVKMGAGALAVEFGGELGDRPSVSFGFGFRAPW